MINDAALTLSANTPAGVPFSVSTTPYDSLLGSDGTHFPFFNTGQRLMARFRVTEAFATATDAGAQFFLIAGDAPAFNGQNAILAACSGGLQLFNGVPWFGFKPGDLPLGRTFDVPLGPVDAAMDTGLVVKDLRYLGAAIMVSNWVIGTATFATFTAGKIQVEILSDHSPVDNNKNDQLVLPRMVVR